MTSCGCNKKKNILEKECPLCKKKAKDLHFMAVKLVVKEELQKYVHQDQYYICNNNDCDVVFFNETGEFIFLTRDINMKANFQEVSKQGEASCKKGCNGCNGCGHG